MTGRVKQDDVVLIQQHEPRNHFKRCTACQFGTTDDKHVVALVQMEVTAPVVQILRRGSLQFVIVNNGDNKIDFARIQIKSCVFAKVLFERFKVGL